MNKKILALLLIFITLVGVIGYARFAHKLTNKRNVPQIDPNSSRSTPSIIGEADNNVQNCDSIVPIQGVGNIIFCRDHIDFNQDEFLTIGSKVLENTTSFPQLFKNVKSVGVFPKINPQFLAVTAYEEYPTGTIETVGIYQINGTPKRMYETENSNGLTYGRYLNYQFSNSTASFIKTRSLGAIGCGGCALEWKDYYIWNENAHSFVLDNLSHLDYFSTLLTKYNSVNNAGCTNAVVDTEKDQDKLSLDEIYKKYPSQQEYCGAGSGINKDKVNILLRAIRTLQSIQAGKNLGSGDILKQDIQ